MKEFMTIKEFAQYVAETVRYAGGYLYPGSRWSHGLSNSVARSKAPHPTPGDAERNEAILASLPQGTVVSCFTTLAGGEEEEHWIKMGDGFILDTD